MKPESFISELSIDEVSKLSPEDIDERLQVEQTYLNNLSHEKYPFATDGSKTKNGG